MPTTIFTGTFSPGSVDVQFRRQSEHSPADSAINEVTETDLISPISSGSVVLEFVTGGFKTTTDFSGSADVTSYDTASSDAASALLNLDPTKTYTLTITEN
jgi:hypothetical protein